MLLNVQCPKTFCLMLIHWNALPFDLKVLLSERIFEISSRQHFQSSVAVFEWRFYCSVWYLGCFWLMFYECMCAAAPRDALENEMLDLKGSTLVKGELQRSINNT